MNNKLLKSLSVFALISTASAFSMTYAAKSDEVSENIEVTQQAVTPQELAAIHVLSEVCPKLIDQKDEQAFDEGYARLVKDYMPNESNPETALKKLSKQKSFQSILKEARSDAKKAGNKQNLAVCEDVKAYQS